MQADGLMFRFVAGLAAVSMVVVDFLAVEPAMAQTGDEESALDIVAASVRDTGHSCDDPKQTTRDEAASKPDEAAWIIDCGNARYRVIYQGDEAVDVEELE